MAAMKSDSQFMRDDDGKIIYFDKMLSINKVIGKGRVY